MSASTPSPNAPSGLFGKGQDAGHVLLHGAGQRRHQRRVLAGGGRGGGPQLGRLLLRGGSLRRGAGL
eukprot:9404070-Pyramimonas_sp.AAC.1